MAQEIKMPNTGRFVHWEKPDDFNKIVDDFLTSVEKD